MTNKRVSVEQACRIIKQGGVVAVPTETVYGLAGSIYSEWALKQIFQIKKRPLFDPLIVHFSGKKQLRQICCYDSSIVEKLSDYFHPGPLTLVLRKTKKISSLITSGLNKVAVRNPSHPLTLELIEKTGTPLAAPSANIFSKTSPTRASHVLDTLPVPVLDGGPCEVGIESTIVEVLPEKKTLEILRPGVVGPVQLEDFLKNHGFLDWKAVYSKTPSGPGQSSQHYQPEVPLVMIELVSNEVVAAGYRSQGSVQEAELRCKIEEKLHHDFPDRTFCELKLKTDPYIVSRELYCDLKNMSKKKGVVAYVVKNEMQDQEGVWHAIWNRLKKASSKNIQISL